MSLEVKAHLLLWLRQREAGDVAVAGAAIYPHPRPSARCDVVKTIPVEALTCSATDYEAAAKAIRSTVKFFARNYPEPNPWLRIEYLLENHTPDPYCREPFE